MCFMEIILGEGGGGGSRWYSDEMNCNFIKNPQLVIYEKSEFFPTGKIISL